MKAQEFDQVNVRIAENQEEYETLPAFISATDPYGKIVTCFELSEDEIEEVVKTGKLWHTQLGFQKPMQPILMTVKNPFEIGVVEEKPEDHEGTIKYGFDEIDMNALLKVCGPEGLYALAEKLKAVADEYLNSALEQG